MKIELDKNTRFGLALIIAVVVYSALYFHWFSADVQTRKWAGEWLGLSWLSEATIYLVVWAKYALLNVLAYTAYRYLFPDHFVGRSIGIGKTAMLFFSVFLLYLIAFYVIDGELSVYILMGSFKVSDVAEQMVFIIVFLVIVPTVEELCFRGILMGTMLNLHFVKAERLRVGLACVIPSLLFVAGHYHYQHMLTFVQLFIFAIIVSIARLLSRGLLLPILLHSFAIFCGLSFIY